MKRLIFSKENQAECQNYKCQHQVLSTQINTQYAYRLCSDSILSEVTNTE
jgi:hypothetical protein